MSTCSHPGMVCLCGRLLSERLEDLFEPGSRIVSYSNWDRIPPQDLYEEMIGYPTFQSMYKSLSRPEFKSALDLLRSDFAGFLEEVQLPPNDARLARSLTAEGVLTKQTALGTSFRMASPLVDGFLRTRL